MAHHQHYMGTKEGRGKIKCRMTAITAGLIRQKHLLQFHITMRNTMLIQQPITHYEILSVIDKKRVKLMEIHKSRKYVLRLYGMTD